MKAFKIFGFCAFLALAGVCVSSAPVYAESDVISEIRVEGTERIEPSTVLSYMDIQVGDEFSSEAVDRSLKNLFSTGLFADVSFYRSGHGLVVTVVENPVINEIAFEGNDVVKDEDLEREIQLRSRVVFTRTKVQADVERMQDIYRHSGYFSATIDPKIIKLDQNRVNLVFEIAEGPKTKVQRITFVGNTHYNDDDLKEVIKTKESRWYRILTSDDKYDPDRLAYDKEQLRRFYLDHGYADVRVDAAVAELTPDRKDFFVTFTLEEGDRYAVGKTEVESKIADLKADNLKESVLPVTGEWYNAKKVEDTVVAMTNKAGDLQFAFVDVKPQVERNREAKTIDIKFVVNESPRVFVEKININGNVRTLDEVIRREMLLVEGDPYNTSKLKKSEQRIKDLGFFENVTVTPTQGSAPDQSVVDITVEEKSTGELSVGAGFSTQDGALADFRLRERNFLGKGQDLLFATTLAQTRQEYDISFTEPYFMKRDVSAGFDVFRISRDLQDESSYDQNQDGLALRLGYPLGANLRHSLIYRIENNEIENVQPTASTFIRQQEGKRLTSAVGHKLEYDLRDSTAEPTEGYILRLENEVSGLGGDSRYLSTKVGGNYYYSIADHWVLSLLGEAGYIFGYSNEDVAINERYFIGGTTLRGFERAGIGPRDTTTGDALGGNEFYRGSVELAFPTGLPDEMGIGGHIFSDFGALTNLDDSGPSIVDENSLRLSVGTGVSWRSPLGPVRADLAFPIVKEDFDVKEVFRFSFGTRF